MSHTRLRGLELNGEGGGSHQEDGGRVEHAESSMLSQTLKPVREEEKSKKGSTCGTAHKTLTS